MFGLSFGELVIIFGVALLVLGPKGLPEMARKLGGWLRQFRSATSELRGTFESEFYKMDGGPLGPTPSRPAIRSVEGVVPRPSGPSSIVMAPGGANVPAPAPPVAPAPTSATPLDAALQAGTSAPQAEPAAPAQPPKPPEGMA